MKELVLTRDHMIQMLLDPGFFTACGEFAYLREAAASAHAARKADAKANCCGREWRYYRGAVDALFLKLKDLPAIPGAADRLKAYLAGKKRYYPDRVTVYYRRSRAQGAIAKFQL